MQGYLLNKVFMVVNPTGRCPKCGKELGKVRGRSSYACFRSRGHHYYPLANTIFKNSKLHLTTWFLAFYLYVENRSAITLENLQSKLGISKKSAFSVRRLMKTRSDEIRKFYPTFPTQEENDEWQEQARKKFYQDLSLLFKDRAFYKKRRKVRNLGKILARVVYITKPCRYCLKSTDLHKIYCSKFCLESHIDKLKEDSYRKRLDEQLLAQNSYKSTTEVKEVVLEERKCLNCYRNFPVSRYEFEGYCTQQCLHEVNQKINNARYIKTKPTTDGLIRSKKHNWSDEWSKDNDLYE